MRLGFDYDERQSQAFADRLQALGVAADNVRPALEDVADDFLDMERRAFTTSGASIGARWEPLRPGRPGTNPHELVATGALFRSLTSAHAPDTVRRITADSVTMGTSKKGLPRRRYVLVKVDRRDGARWADLVADHLFGPSRGLL